MNSTLAAKIASEARRAVAGVFADRTYEIRMPDVTWSPTSVRIVVEVVEADQVPGSLAQRQADDFVAHAVAYGLRADDLGRSFAYQDRRFTITGLNYGARQSPIVVRDDHGKTWAFRPETVAESLDVEDAGNEPPRHRPSLFVSTTTGEQQSLDMRGRLGRSAPVLRDVDDPDGRVVR